MLSVIQVVTLLLVAVTMSMALAHVLEFPGKKRLEKDAYLAVQTIYYPGFTIAGFAEPVSIIPTILLLFITPTGSLAFWLTLIAFVSLVVMHAIFWIVTQPVNKFWLKNQQLSKLGDRFFSPNSTVQHGEETNADVEDWEKMRDRWEYSHLARAVFCVIAMITLTVALAMPR